MSADIKPAPGCKVRYTYGQQWWYEWDRVANDFVRPDEKIPIRPNEEGILLERWDDNDAWIIQFPHAIFLMASGLWEVIASPPIPLVLKPRRKLNLA